MENILDNDESLRTDAIQYGGFWIRFGALFLDGLILGIPIGGLTFYNGMEWKSIPLLIVLSIAGLAYKPIMEAVYGATLGKMAVGIVVVNYQFEKANNTEVLLRNILHIGMGIIGMVASVMLYMEPGFEDVSGFMEYNTFTQTHQNTIPSIIIVVVYIIDAIVLLTDKQKRSLHDKIGKTYVVKKESARLVV